jgi:hypothetical protein
MTAAIVAGALFAGAWFLAGTWKTGGDDPAAGRPVADDD